MQNNQHNAGHEQSHRYGSLQELFDACGFHGKYDSEEISTGMPVGNEKLDDFDDLDDLFKDFHGAYRFEEMDWGGPVGNEVW